MGTSVWKGRTVEYFLLVVVECDGQRRETATPIHQEHQINVFSDLAADWQVSVTFGE